MHNAASSAPPSLAALSSELLREGWARRTAAEMLALLQTDELGWQNFANEWRNLPVDKYMADAGLYRRRRYGAFDLSSGSIVPVPRQPHYQSLEHNALNGGIDRWFEPLVKEVADSAILRRILECCHEACSGMELFIRAWRAEVHQFRIETTTNSAGFPTPEGCHRDGVTAGCIMLVARERVQGGETRLWTPDGSAQLASFQMTVPGEALFFDDRKLLHEVSPVFASPEVSGGHRDVLVVTFTSS